MKVPCQLEQALVDIAVRRVWMQPRHITALPPLPLLYCSTTLVQTVSGLKPAAGQVQETYYPDPRCLLVIFPATPIPCWTSPVEHLFLFAHFHQ